jgi:hypothetical protein
LLPGYFNSVRRPRIGLASQPSAGRVPARGPGPTCPFAIEASPFWRLRSPRFRR